MKSDKNDAANVKPLLPALLRRYGVLRMVLVVSILAVLVSVIITSITLYFVDGQISLTGVMVSILVPLVLAPFSSYNSFKLVHRLDKTEEQLRRISNTDDLTKSFSRRYFMEQAAFEFERAKRYGQVFSIAIMDFDNFKDINDGHSHLAGDAALKLVARICLENLRQVDVFARYGGDEFIFLFPATNAGQATDCLARILLSIADLDFRFGGKSIPIRVSVGAAAFHEFMSDFDDILCEADFALYSAKRQGGMRAVAHHT